MSPRDSASVEHRRLTGVMDRYLEALAAHDLGALRFGATLRNTENTRELPLGSGLARTVRGRRPGGQHFVDIEIGQAEYWGVIDEMGAEAIYGVRLRIEGTLITEIETLVVRGGGSFFEPAVVSAPAPGFHEPVPSPDRSPRERLIEIANLYFDAIEQSDGSRVPVTDDCRRLVNGVTDSRMDPERIEPGEAHRALGVAEQMTARHYAYIEALRARRFPVADVARGLVVCHVLFDHPGDRERADGAYPFRSPNSMLAFEVFKVRRGVLEEVWAIGTALPYGIDCGWPL
jgi:hypothetical protein